MSPHGATRGSPPRRLTAMERSERRRALVFTAVKSVVFFLAVMAAYFLLPVGGHSEGTNVLQLVLGVLLFAGVLAWQVRRIMRSAVPTLQAVEALIVAVPIFIVAYASTYAGISSASPDSFTERLDKIGALYFTIVTLGTVGYGDIAPVTAGARLAVSSQVMLDLVLIAVVVRLLTSAAKRSLDRRAGPPEAS